VTPHYLPEYPTHLPKHLVCQDCCPDSQSANLYPSDEIIYPDNTERPILTKDEFTADGTLKAIDYERKHYCYVFASIIDYTAQVINKGAPLHGKAGKKNDYQAKFAEDTMIKEEYE